MAKLMNRRMDFHTRPDWETVEISSVNRMPAHSRWGAYDTQERAKECRYGTSPYTIRLNGDYRFRLYSSPEAVDEFYRIDYDDSQFSFVAVPGNWETQGFGEPIYTNIVYPWADTEQDCLIEAKQGEPRVPNPPYVPKQNPTGAYRYWFTVPDTFEGREVYLRFEGVEAAFYLWINGQPVGYSEDSKLPAEFCVTQYLQKGENLMALQVMRFASSSYLEDQDYWYLSGIYRSVWMISKQKLHIDDIQLQAIPDLCHGFGTVRTDVTVSREPYFADCSVRVTIYDPQGNCMATQTSQVCKEAEYRTDRAPTANTARTISEISGVHCWSPERPVLYTAVVTLLALDGTVLDVESCRFGFKKIEVRHGVVYLNGRRLIIRGVNRHEHFYLTGRAGTREEMLEEIRQMKRMNINAVRTCHYPDCPDWYELCDEYGLLLVCECDIETHGVSGAITHNPEWAPNFVERAARMVRNYKNHVSIFSWSLGNESGTGPNHAAMYGFIKEYDPTRLCQYESGEPGKRISDVRGNMYAPVDKILHMLSDPEDDRPIILVEYLYQIRNSGGGMERFLELTQRYERFQGGFIWDWQDKCLKGTAADGTTFFAYGGDFNESFVEKGECPRFMTCNGIVLPDLTWKPVAYEVKAAYAPVQIQRPENWSPRQTAGGWNTFLLSNDSQELSLDDFSCYAVLRENGYPIGEQQVLLPHLPAGQSTVLTVEIPHRKKPGAVYTIEFSVRRREETFYAPAEQEIGLFQFALESGPAETVKLRQSGNTPCWTKQDDLWVITAGRSQWNICAKTGELTLWSKNGIPYVLGGARSCFDRPYTGLDAQPGWGWYEDYAKIRDQRLISDQGTLLEGNGLLQLGFSLYQSDNTAPEISGKLIYTFYGDETVDLSVDFHLDSSYYAVPRVGLEWVLADGFEMLSYFGRGGVENYPDRLLAAPLGVYTSTISEQHFPFVPPSETGGHEETRWVTFTQDSGAALCVSSKQPFHFDALHHRIEDYKTAAHDFEMPVRKETIFHIDAAYGPIGGDMAWSTEMPSKYKLSGADYHLSIQLKLEDH